MSIRLLLLQYEYALQEELRAWTLTIYLVHLYYNIFIFLSFRQLLVTLHIKNNLVLIAYNFMQKSMNGNTRVRVKHIFR